MTKASNKNLYLAASIACMTGALFGYSVGFIGGILVLPSFLHHFHLDNLPTSELASATASTVAIWLIGAFFGVPLGMPICSRWGRRYCLIFSASIYMLGAGLQLVDAQGKLALFDLGRLLNGFGVGAGTLVSPIYISEISTASERGMLLSGYQTAIQLAALVGFWAAYAAHATLPDDSILQWQIPVAIQLIPGCLLLLGTLLIPESPRFLADEAWTERARNSLAWLRSLPEDDAGIAQELNDLQDSTAKNDPLQVGETSLFKALRTTSLRKRVMVGVGLMIAQNMVGLNALNYYAPTIFASAGFTSVSSSLLLTGIFGIVKVLTATAFMFVFVRFRGNRFWLRLGCIICALSMAVLAYCVRTMPSNEQDGDESRLTFKGIISVLMVYIFAFAFGISLGPMSWNVCSEIFPQRLKAGCCAITTCVQWFFQIVIAGITPPLLAQVGWATYVIYACFCAVSFVWITAAVPETKGVVLGKAMDQLFGDYTDNAILEDEEEPGETTTLLGKSPRVSERRASVGFAV